MFMLVNEVKFPSQIMSNKAQLLLVQENLFIVEVSQLKKFLTVCPMYVCYIMFIVYDVYNCVK